MREISGTIKTFFEVSFYSQSGMEHTPWRKPRFGPFLWRACTLEIKTHCLLQSLVMPLGRIK